MEQPFDQTQPQDASPLPATDPFAGLMAAVQQNQQSSPTTPAPAPTPQAQPQQAAQPPSPRFIAADLIRGMVNPSAVTLANGRPASGSAPVFENFLSNFVQAVGAGFSAGHGP